MRGKKPGEKRRGGRWRREKEREDKNEKMGKTRKRRGAERERESKRGRGNKTPEGPSWNDLGHKTNDLQ